MPETKSDGLFNLGKAVASSQIHERTLHYIHWSWSEGTKKQYNSHLKKWFTFCIEWNCDPYKTTVKDLLYFLTDLADKGLSYSVIKATKSAILHINVENPDIHNNKLISQFMKGVFKKRPPVPKYFNTWDPQQVLNYIKSWRDDGTLKQLSFKTAFLLLLCSAKRGKEIIDVHIENIQISDVEVIIRPGDFSKTSSKPNVKDPLIHLPKFSQDLRICVYTHLIKYLTETESIRKGEKQLFISFQKPHKRISRDTLSRWIKCMLKKGGVDTDIYTTHSLRHAATSSAAAKNVSLATILASVGWKSESTFTTIY